MKSEPIGLDYLLPVWVTRAAAVVAGLVMLAIAWVVVKVLIATPQQWPSAIRMVILGSACFAVIQRARNVIPRLRDRRFRERIRKFNALKKQPWDAMLDQLVDDPAVEFHNEEPVTMANPFSWGRKQSIVTVREADLLADILESNGRVGSIRLRLVIED